MGASQLMALGAPAWPSEPELSSHTNSSLTEHQLHHRWGARRRSAPSPPICLEPTSPPESESLEEPEPAATWHPHDQTPCTLCMMRHCHAAHTIMQSRSLKHKLPNAA